ncbi:MAG: leucine-rich repeat domain-containing protein, partial [Candidatus Poribacteria bacterium]|nr:leucine-rich repeat domain-containing protein [Candidatus Poribacteria bacterium]
MRKVLPITVIFLLLTLSITPLATAQKQNIIVNETTETLYVISSTKFGAQGDIPAGYRTSGWKTIAAGEQRAFWAYDPHKIYFQIWKGSEPIKPQRSTDTLAFWINRNANFDIVTRQEINGSITRAQLLYSSHGTDPLTHRDGFMRYDNGSRITVTNAWVNVAVEGLDPPGEDAETEEPAEEDAGDEEAPMEDGDGDGLGQNGGLAQDGDGQAPMEDAVVPNALVHIPDSQLRAAIEGALGKVPGDTITATDIQKLTVLVADGQGIEDLNGLQFAINLTELGGNHNQITDVSPLAGLTNLTRLFLGYNQITDVSPLVGLSNLTTLALENNAILDFSPIGELIPNLEFYADHNQRAPAPNDLVNIPDPVLRRAIVKALKIPENTPITLAEMERLTLLQAGLPWRSGDPTITDLTGLEFATNLTELEAYWNEISDVSPLADLTKLTRLILTGNNISDVSPLVGLENLRVLDLSETGISNVSVLAKLVDLTELELNTNRISDVSPLSGLINLTRLELNTNRISDVSPLSRLINLTDLNLQVNDISDVSPLSRLVNLAFLSLGLNDISDVSPLAGLIRLKNLGLNENYISDVSPLAGLIQLEFLDLSGNAISDFSPIAGLIPNLKGYWNDNQRAIVEDLNFPVNIRDPNLRVVIEEALDQAQGTTITARKMRRLSYIGAEQANVQDLTGLEFATNLIRLDLEENAILDISPLSGLINLTWLDLRNNAISDVS